ncbi:MAG: hypothetical protein CL916_07305 [Deltaproteobacteria bacterium]|nr:hypothetical protein [Deltaproteobacteria bacterium]
MWKLTIIGAGRFGRSLESLLSIPYTIVGKNEKIPISDIYYLTVPDRAIKDFASILPQKSTVIHACGSLSHTILRPHPHTAVLHPIMTFPGPEIGMPSPPIYASICGDKQAIPKAQWLADRLGFSTFHYNGNRARYHCAAVMAGNFGAVLLDMAAAIMASDCELSKKEARQKLLPLMMESIKNYAQEGQTAFTGPVIRKDEHTLSKHRTELLSFSEHFIRTYNSLVESLTQQIKEKN